MIFISIPFSSDYKEVTDYRIKMASIYAGHLLKESFIPVSPILFGSKVLEHVNISSDFKYWEKLCYAYLDTCSEIHVLCLDGFKESKGVQGEIEHAAEKGLKILFINVYKHSDGVYYFSDNEEELKKLKFSKKIIEMHKNLFTGRQISNLKN